MNLSKNFSLKEMTYSSTADNLKIDNTPNGAVIENLKALCIKLLQPIRDKFGVINITSGYRSKALNKEVKGSITSNHLYGYAADIQCKGHTLQEIYHYVVNNLVFDECFIEENKKGTKWLHLAYRKNEINRRKSNPNYKA